MIPKKRKDGVWRESGIGTDSWDPLVRESEDPDELQPASDPDEPKAPRAPKKAKRK